MKNILITENQLKLISEALGVPDTILDVAEQVFDSVAQDIKSIRTKTDEYIFRGSWCRCWCRLTRRTKADRQRIA